MSGKEMAAAFEKAEREYAEAVHSLNITDENHIEAWLEVHIEADADLGWLASTIADAHKAQNALLATDIVRLRGFIKSIDDDWIKNDPAGDDEWNDGYEDCLTDYASKARKILGGADLEEVAS